MWSVLLHIVDLVNPAISSILTYTNGSCDFQIDIAKIGYIKEHLVKQPVWQIESTLEVFQKCTKLSRIRCLVVKGRGKKTFEERNILTSLKIVSRPLLQKRNTGTAQTCSSLFLKKLICNFEILLFTLQITHLQPGLFRFCE